MADPSEKVKIPVKIELPGKDYSILREMATEGGYTVARICEHAVQRFLVWKLAQLAGRVIK